MVKSKLEIKRKVINNSQKRERKQIPKFDKKTKHIWIRECKLLMILF